MPPPTADEFAVSVRAARAVSGGLEASAAAALYAGALVRRLADLRELRLVEEGWGDQELIGFAGLLHMCTKLTSLTVGVEGAGAASFAALGEVVASGSLSSLTYLSLGKHSLGGEAKSLVRSCAALSQAVPLTPHAAPLAARRTPHAARPCMRVVRPCTCTHT